MNPHVRAAWGHAVAILKALKGTKHEPQAKGLVEALERIKEQSKA